jgi:hypothetical protein
MKTICHHCEKGTMSVLDWDDFSEKLMVCDNCESIMDSDGGIVPA